MHSHRSLAICLPLLAGCSSTHDEHRPPQAGPTPAPAFVYPDVLGVPLLEDDNPDPNIVEVRLTAGKTSASFGDGTSTGVYAYNGQLPGPLLRAKVGDEVIVHFKNDLPSATTIHWHGLRIPDDMDGSPRVRNPVKAGEEFTYRFKVPDAGSFWYHPHVRAAEQVEKGLYAPLVVFDPRGPQYDGERFLVVDDIRLDEGGRIAPESSMDGTMGGRFGNVLLTNGRPIEEAIVSVEQGTVERWRIVNTANARTMELGIEGATFRVIATDGGVLREPFTPERLIVAVGQRFDLELTFDRPGKAKLISFVQTVDAKNRPLEQSFAAFTAAVAANDRAPRVVALPEVKPLERAPDATGTITLDVVRAAKPWTINGKADPMDPIFSWTQGATIDLAVVNKTTLEHPFHLHGQFFEILDARQPGLKDVVLVPPSATVNIRAYLDNPGRWMAHCHILEHGELGMMSEFVVAPRDGSAPAPPAGAMTH